MLLGNNNLKAHGGAGIDGDGLMIGLSVITGVIGAPIISLTPYLVKDNNTHYSYGATLLSTIASTIIIPSIIGGITNDKEIIFASTLVAPLIGTSLGFNYTKSTNKDVAENKGGKIIKPFLLIGATISFFLASGILK